MAGQITRDLALLVDDVPEGGQTAPVRARREMLGGKGANQAVGLAQLGVAVAVLGVVGDDEVADSLLAQLHHDGVDAELVVRRPDARTGLIVDIVDAGHTWRYLEDIPREVLLREADVLAAKETLASAAATVVQLQQPPEAALAVARCARDGDGLVVLDGVPGQDELLDAADVLRADAKEANLIAGTTIETEQDAVRIGRDLCRAHGLTLVALAVADNGNAFVWPDGHEFIPHGSTKVVDTTGAGDALIAGLTSVLCRGGTASHAAQVASAAAAATIGHLGGRPDLSALRNELPV